MADWYEREEQLIMAAHDRGEITAAEMWRQLMELQRDYRDMAEEAAERAYRDELDRW